MKPQTDSLGLNGRTHGAFPVFCCMALAILALIFCGGCATTTNWQSQLAPGTLGNEAVVAAAKHYGGQKAAELASAGLYATADVLQGYVDKKPPLEIITESPGVEGVGHVLLDYLKEKKVVSQETVDSIHEAAAFAARVTYPAPQTKAAKGD